MGPILKSRWIPLAATAAVVVGGPSPRALAGGDDAAFAAWIYSIERLGRLLSIEELGGKRWYPDACRYLASVQFADGSFEERSRGAVNGPVRTTADVILFLLRATPAITDTSDD